MAGNPSGNSAFGRANGILPRSPWSIQSCSPAANPGSEPSHSHEEWLKEKAATGWKYGPVKDLAKKEHPCFVPYDELPPEQKAKNALFVGVVNALRAYD